jgi:pimeloyl-ACP methyl ester carboxylesterase
MTKEALVASRSGWLAVRDHGGTGPPVVLLHGAGHNLEVWRKVIDIIGGRARVVSTDLRGHGWSTADAPFTLADLAGDAVRVCAATMLDRPVLVGHSLGGWVALVAAAAEANARSLVVVDGPVASMDVMFRGLGLTPDDGAGGADELEASAFRGDDAAWTKRLDACGSPGSVMRAVAERGRLRDAEGLFYARPVPATLLAAQQCVWQIDPATAYRQVRIPVKILLATRMGNIANPQRFNEIQRRAADSLADIEGVEVSRVRSGHHMPVECPGPVADAVLNAASE